MVSSKKAKTGGGAGSATHQRQDGRWAVLEVSREHNVYVTTKVDITADADAPTELCTGCRKLLSTLKESNETCILLPVRTITTYNAIVEPDNIPAKIPALMRNFTATSKIRDKTRSVWATARLGSDGNF